MRSVAFVLTPGFALIDLGAAMAFQAANLVTRDAVYTVSFLSELGGPVPSSAGLVVETASLGKIRADTVFWVGTASPRAPSTAAISFLHLAKEGSRRLAASSTATFLFAAAGLLDGKRATTHWQHVAELRQRFPQVRVEPDRIFVADGQIWTSAGMTADLDLALALVEDDLGPSVSAEVAKQLILYYRRPGEQSQSSALMEMSPRTDRIRRVLSFARENLRKELSVEDLAEVAHLSPRQFSRLFRRETGQSPAKAVEALRLEAAKTMLEERPQSLDMVAYETGFTDRGRMRRAFVRAFGESPRWFRDSGRDCPALADIAA